MSITPFDTELSAYLSADPDERACMDAAFDSKAAAYSKLLLIRSSGGTVSASEYAEACRTLGLSKRQIQRQLNALTVGAPAPTRQAFTLSEHHRKVIFALNGNVKRAYEELYANTDAPVSFAQFWRAWYTVEPMATQEFARRGGEAMTSFWIYTPYSAPERNTVWQADHFELPIDVIADGYTTTLVKPWLTIFVDDTTRKIMSWALTAEPNRRADADTVRATIAAGIRVRLEDGVEVGGVPRIVRWDNDRSFTAGMVTQLGTVLGFECHAVPPYSGHMKGKVERLGRRVQEQLIALLPGFTHGPRTFRGKDPFRDTEPLTAAQLRGRLDLWFAEYNRTLHEGIGMTPMERWCADIDTAPLRIASDDKLRTTLLVEKRKRKVIKRNGVSFRGKYWASAELQKHVNQHLEVRYPIVGDDFIELYGNGKWVCTAWPVDQLTETQKKAIWDGRSTNYHDARRLLDAASELRQGAEAEVGTTDATPSVVSVPAVDPLKGDLDDLLDLIHAKSKAVEEDTNTKRNAKGADESEGAA